MTDKDSSIPGTNFVHPVLLGKETVRLKNRLKDRRVVRNVRVYGFKLDAMKLDDRTGRITFRGGLKAPDFRGAEQVDFIPQSGRRILLEPAKSGPQTQFVPRKQILAEQAKKRETERVLISDRPKVVHQEGMVFRNLEELRAELPLLDKLLGRS